MQKSQGGLGSFPTSKLGTSCAVSAGHSCQTPWTERHIEFTEGRNEYIRASHVRLLENNFGKALAALKDTEHRLEHDSTCNVRYHDTAECDCGKSELQHLIAELEEVKK